MNLTRRGLFGLLPAGLLAAKVEAAPEVVSVVTAIDVEAKRARRKPDIVNTRFDFENGTHLDVRIIR